MPAATSNADAAVTGAGPEKPSKAPAEDEAYAIIELLRAAKERAHGRRHDATSSIIQTASDEKKSSGSSTRQKRRKATTRGGERCERQTS